MRKALVVGLGSIAKRHINNLTKLYPEITVICVSASGRSIETDEVNAFVTTDSLESLDLDAFDIAIVASPAPFHLTHARPLVSANIPVLIEKPLCSYLSELHYPIFFKPEAKIGVGYNLRFMPSAQRVKQILNEGLLGQISTVFSEVGQYLPDWRPNSDYRTGVSAQRKLGGGALLELSHELDYLNWMFGGFTQVLGKMRTSKQLEIDVEDSVDALLINDESVLFHLHLDFLQKKPSRSLKIIGQNGTLIWDLIANQVVVTDSKQVSQIMFSDPGYDRNEMYLEQLRAFAGFTKGSEHFGSTIKSAFDVMKLVEAIRLSDKNGCWIKTEDIF
jgi:predicted dehydrogenase